jgi:CheY-like chemotaxis protein
MADDLWCVEADIRQLSQVLHNILINALQAMPHGGEVTVRAMNEMIGPVNAYQLDPGDYLKIVIKDNGCGISPEDLPKIFDPYFTTKSQGSGLGLSSVYSIVRRHGGTVEAASIVGVGSTFSIYLPASSCMLPDGAVIRKDALLAGSGRILVMDDEDIVREIVSEILEFIGYNVETCTNGKEAVELFRSAHERNVPFDVVILDLTVPGGMGGKEAATQLLEIDPEAVLIVSSGYFDDPVVANFRQYGFRDAMSKPFTASSLARGLEKLISKKHLKSKY